MYCKTITKEIFDSYIANNSDTVLEGVVTNAFEGTAFRRFVRVPLAKGEHYVEALYEQDFGSFPLAMGANHFSIKNGLEFMAFIVDRKETYCKSAAFALLFDDYRQGAFRKVLTQIKENIMKIQKTNTGILITKTAKQPSAKIEFSLDELDALSEFCERLQDEKDIREYLNTAVAIPDSAEVSAPVAAKYLRDAALFEQLVDETRRNQEENQSDFLTAVSDAVSSIEKSRDVKEWQGLTKETAERFAREFMAERNPGRWSGFGEVPESVSLDPLNFPINDIYPKGNKPALRMQLISVTYPSLHRVCECSIIEDGVDLWARRTLDSMTAGTVEDLVETVLYVAHMYERSKCFERIYVNRIQMEKSEHDALIRHLNDPDSINDGYQISDVVFAADNTIVSVLWEGNSKDGVSGMVTLAVNGKTVYKTKNTKVFCNHWILPYNGAEYHVLVDVLPKKTILEETVYISEPYAERIEKHLRGEEAQGDGSSLSKTAKFSDGFEMDIRCCGGKDDSWTEAILYDNTGKEVVATEPCDGFTGCWELKDEDTNTVYRAHVMTKPNLN